MSTRPETLFPLFADIKSLVGVGPRVAEHLKAVGLTRPRDLLMTLPNSGIDRKTRASVCDAGLNEVVSVEVVVGKHLPNVKKNQPYRVNVEDAQTTFQLVFFHARSDWLKRTLPTGQRRVVSGKVEIFDGIAQMVHPDHIVPLNEAANIPKFEPIYPLGAGLGQGLMYRATGSAIERAPDLPEWIAPSLMKKMGWPSWQEAVHSAHRPASQADISPQSPARARLAYDEFLAHQMTLAQKRAENRRTKGRKNVSTDELQRKAWKTLPFAPTTAQNTAIGEIVHDMASPYRMNRLLQGDVGSGKTLVALMALLAAVEAGGQGVMMVPTGILARQHLEVLRPICENVGVVIGCLTGRDKGTARRDKLAALANGDIQILLGTHAVFQKEVEFCDLRLAIIDEQHRFGVRQRMELGAKGADVDVLVMTATPIPRSLALAQFGDMDLSVLDEKPPGRKPVDTVAVPENRLDQVISRLRLALNEGRQAYWVCPLVNQSKTVEWMDAESRASQLKLVLGEGTTGLIHGQMPEDEKDAAMQEFIDGRTGVLVATTVIEVGVDVPNASIMVIEHAEHFGLAQLHQLRGRVGRGGQVSSCVLVYSAPLGTTAEKRLDAMRQSGDGFYLAEQDLKLRGAGDVLGVQQSGVPKFRIADMETQANLLKIAQSDARSFLEIDPEFGSARGEAMHTLLSLMERDTEDSLITIG